MTWVKLDDGFFTHPKVVELSNEAKLLYIAGLSYCSANLTDGAIPNAAVPIVGAMANVTPAAVAEELTAAGLWEVSGRGFMVHDYLAYNPTAEQVKQQRATNAQRQADWRERKQARNAVTHSVSNAPNNGPVTPAPYPVPVTSPEEATTAVVATAAVARPRPHVELVQHSEGARVVLEEWRRAHGKRSPPKLNPTQAQRLENAVVDLGVDRLAEAARYTAEKGLGEFHKCVTSAYTKRKLDEDRTAEPVMQPAGTPRGAGRDSRNPRDYFHSAARR